MELSNKRKKSKYSEIIWIVMVGLLGIVPCGALPTGPLIGPQTVDSDETLYLGAIYDPNVGVDDGYVIVYGTLNMYPGAYVDWGIYAFDSSAVNIYAGEHGTGYFIWILEGSIATIYGTNFELSDASNVVLDNSENPTKILITNTTQGGWGTLTWTYGGISSSIDFITYVDIQLVGSPELLIQQLIANVEALNLKQGIDNSLHSKLENALVALEAANAGQRQDTVNKIQAFINAVEAQSGKAILEDDADALINSAQQIINLLDVE